MDYKQAGVDVEAGYKAVELMKASVEKTFVKGVIGGLGGFGGLFELDLDGIQKPVLVSGTDGVGTKLKLAFLQDKHDTIGIDCVAMCVNDVLCAGAKPLFFLDYIAVGKNIPEKVAQIVTGVADGCEKSGCALVGGETAEMPDFYHQDEYDIAGFTVGIVDKDKILDSKNVNIGNKIIALPSSGVHSNGFSLVRKIFNIGECDLNKQYDIIGKTLGEELLTPTKLYVKPIVELLKQVEVKSIAHITGGGFYENIPRALNDNVLAKVYKNKVKVLPIFELIAKEGNISEKDMFNTFNMGVGMIVIVDEQDVDKTMAILESQGEQPYIMGEIVAGQKGIEIC
ncbi:phosphoribosylformylglycinamidine cyclo-ligase [Candidatus Epulonipiscium fishelsonii]|uniref:Phosphoribosylformylglycinamidine cyclo-ligase n=1 Tax=Candidatus Epulonipiscium fishelsonii TaxID=77094 RepID=A0ACC8X917_9FIRM|nr:phosphoribosylformylglycinamidine cyclo-ligase [Epulopiscium sp. SCG-D08WGA-EpuloA1]OON92519.1 MAG: phosphoribosylformylglycinamidine cyclo-ligase [Epulopiscium sp. AS2M-Bin002]